MFVRTKISRNNKTVHQLVETARINGKVRQRVIAHLGESASLAAAIHQCEARLEKERQSLADASAKANAITAKLRSQGLIVPDDYEHIRALARYNWNMKFLRTALWLVDKMQRKIPQLENHLARLHMAETKWAKKHGI